MERRNVWMAARRLVRGVPIVVHPPPVTVPFNLRDRPSKFSTARIEEIQQGISEIVEAVQSFPNVEIPCILLGSAFLGILTADRQQTLLCGLLLHVASLKMLRLGEPPQLDTNASCINWDEFATSRRLNGADCSLSIQSVLGALQTIRDQHGPSWNPRYLVEFRLGDFALVNQKQTTQLAEVLASMILPRVNQLVVGPIYPSYSATTTGDVKSQEDGLSDAASSSTRMPRPSSSSPPPLDPIFRILAASMQKPINLGIIGPIALASRGRSSGRLVSREALQEVLRRYRTTSAVQIPSFRHLHSSSLNTLPELALGGLCLDDQDCTLIAQTLADGGVVGTLDLRYNPDITDTGYQQLVSLLDRNTIIHRIRVSHEQWAPRFVLLSSMNRVGRQQAIAKGMYGNRMRWVEWIIAVNSVEMTEWRSIVQDDDSRNYWPDGNPAIMSLDALFLTVRSHADFLCNYK